MSGNWETTLHRIDGGSLMCAIVTGQRGPEQGLLYVAGLAMAQGEMALVLADNDAMAVAGPSIALTIDGVRVGDFAIVKSRATSIGTGVRAAVPHDQIERIFSLFQYGGTVKFITTQQTYTLPLTGFPGSLANMRACMMQVRNLQPDVTN